MRFRVVGLCLLFGTPAHGCSGDAAETASSAARAAHERANRSGADTPAPANTESYPVRWSRELDLRALSDAERRLSAREPHDYAELTLADAKAQPASCVEWLELHAKGYRPAGALEEQTDRAAKIRCQTLSIVKDAKPARTSHVRDLLWDRGLLPVLPAELATVDHPNRQRAVKAASDAGKTLKEFDPKVRAKPVAGDASLVILEGGRRLMISLHGEAWGDFNRDGVDDLVMSVVNGATDGDFSYARVMTVTRKTPDEMLVPIDVR
jgi:hypothetical protein